MNDVRPSVFEDHRMSQEDVRKPFRRRGWIAAIAIATAVGVGVGASAYVSITQWDGELLSSASPAAAQAVPVSVATVERRDTPVWTEFSGRLEAVSHVAIRPRVQGVIMAAHFREGSLVKQGDLLFTIDPAPFQTEVDRLQAQVTAAGARLVLAGRQQQRGLQLGGSEDLAKSEVDQRINEYRAADANLHAAMASLQTAKLNLGYTEVRAPITGRVGKIEVTPGNLVDAVSAPPVLTTLVSVDPIYASFEADEASVADAVASLPEGVDLAAGIARIPVQMGTMAIPGTPLHGTLELLDNVVDANSGTVRVRAVFDNADGHLMPGQFARLRLGRAKARPEITVDERAIGTDQDRRFVMVVGRDNKVAARQVVLGDSADGMRIVTQGLQPGERIVVDGLQRIRPGAVVAPQAVAGTSVQPNTSFASR